MHGGGHMKGMKGMKGWQRFGRGHVIPPQFRGRQYFVHDWRAFGFPAPMAGGQWIRYYDDALLIDGHGRVMDSRHGWDWDRRGGRMDHDEGGYADSGYGRDDDYGRDDYAGRDDDYGRDDDEDGHGRGHHGGGHHGGGHHGKGDRVVRVYRHGEGHGGAYSGGGYGYGSGYGYSSGYGYGAGCACGPVVVTETVTTTAPVMETHTYYETVTERRAAPRRHYRKPVRHYSKPVVRRSVKPAYRAPTPRPGERG
jgi:hypothetical protein